MKKVAILDSTLRDGAQMHGISFSVEDKIKIVKKLDEFGIEYIEAGNPASNPKEREFFEKIKEIKLINSKLVSFGSTRRAGIKPEEDTNLNDLLSTGTEYISIYGKSWDFHVLEVLNTTLEENLKMIDSSIKYLIQNGKKVFFDAEHFFDGYKENKEYAIRVIQTAKIAGAEAIVLCDTNGGTLTSDIYEICKEVCNNNKDIQVGIHCHNDMELAVANSIAAVDAGVTHVQGTINGIGERCGNANLCSIIPTLEIKKDIRTIVDSNKLEKLTRLSKFVSQVANMRQRYEFPYVGKLAFTHKAGSHIDAINKNPKSCEHIEPELVGNERRKVISELSGKSAIIEHINKYIPGIDKNDARVQKIISRIKTLEQEGYRFEDAQATLDLEIVKDLNLYEPLFELIDLKVIVDKPLEKDSKAVAITKIKVENEERISASEGYGPVDALNNSLSKAIGKIYEETKGLNLIDYKVRTIDSADSGTNAYVIVQIQTRDEEGNTWGTVGVSTDIVKASYKALVDSIDYLFLRKKMKI